MKPRLLTLGLVVVLAALIISTVGCGSDTGLEGRNEELMSLVSASLGGTYYIVGSGIAEILTREVDNLQVSCVIGEGSVKNPLLVGTGEIKLGMSNYLSANAAVNGLEPYNETLQIRAIAPLQISVIQPVTFATSDINSWEDMQGKKISIGPAGGGGALLATRIFEEYGYGVDDIVASYLSYAEGSEALKDGQINVNIPHGAPPLEAITSLAFRDEVKIIPIDADKVDTLNAAYPFYQPAYIPAGTYAGINEDVLSVGIQDLLIVYADVDEELVYEMTKALYENIDEIRQIHPSIKLMDFENFKDSFVPLHPGARKYYQEMGISLN